MPPISGGGGGGEYILGTGPKYVLCLPGRGNQERDFLKAPILWIAWKMGVGATSNTIALS